MLKYFKLQGKKGQSTLEYAILIIIIIGALLSIQIYMKRAFQGGLKSTADDVGDQFSFGNQNEIRVMTTSGSTRDTFIDGVTNSIIQEDEITNDYKSSNIIDVNFEPWGFTTPEEE